MRMGRGGRERRSLYLIQWALSLIPQLGALCVSGYFSGCSSAPPPPPSIEHPRSGCHLSCSDHRAMYANRRCQSGNLLGEDISINGEILDEQNPHNSFWLAGKGQERGSYRKDDVIEGTCVMYFAFTRHDVDEHMMGVLNTPGAERP